MQLLPQTPHREQASPRLIAKSLHLSKGDQNYSRNVIFSDESSEDEIAGLAFWRGQIDEEDDLSVELGRVRSVVPTKKMIKRREKLCAKRRRSVGGSPNDVASLELEAIIGSIAAEPNVAPLDRRSPAAARSEAAAKPPVRSPSVESLHRCAPVLQLEPCLLHHKPPSARASTASPILRLGAGEPPPKKGPPSIKGAHHLAKKRSIVALADDEMVPPTKRRHLQMSGLMMPQF